MRVSASEENFENSPRRLASACSWATCVLRLVRVAVRDEIELLVSTYTLTSATAAARNPSKM